MEKRMRGADGRFAKNPQTIKRRKKTCTACGQYLWLGQFYNKKDKKNYPDGHDCRCKECRRKEKQAEYARNRKKPDGIMLNHEGRAVIKNGTSRRLYWGEERTKDFRRLYPTHTNDWMAVEFECSPRTITRRAREMGLEKDPTWLRAKWDKGRHQANILVRVLGTKADLTNFIEGGKKHRFTSENHPSKYETPEQRSARLKKAWETRKGLRRKIRTVSSGTKQRLQLQYRN